MGIAAAYPLHNSSLIIGFAAALNVTITNSRAQALDERLGFIVTQELPSSLKNEQTTVAAHWRMEKQIIP